MTDGHIPGLREPIRPERVHPRHWVTHGLRGPILGLQKTYIMPQRTHTVPGGTQRDHLRGPIWGLIRLSSYLRGQIQSCDGYFNPKRHIRSPRDTVLDMKGHNVGLMVTTWGLKWSIPGLTGSIPDLRSPISGLKSPSQAWGSVILGLACHFRSVKVFLQAWEDPT